MLEGTLRRSDFWYTKVFELLVIEVKEDSWLTFVETLSIAVLLVRDQL